MVLKMREPGPGFHLLLLSYDYIHVKGLQPANLYLVTLLISLEQFSQLQFKRFHQQHV